MSRILELDLKSEFINKYPTSDVFIESLEHVEKAFLPFYLRYHVHGGIPFFLKDNPFVYEKCKQFIADRLSLNPRDITIIGSRAIGFSMSPPPKFGNAARDDSDMDFSIVSEQLFHEMKNVFNQWMADYNEGKISPDKTEKEKYWLSNKETVPKNLNRGFIDNYKIPNRYPIRKKTDWVLKDIARYLIKECSLHCNAKASARIYKDWDSFEKQFMINFMDMKSKVSKGVK
ncbi:hypothetical protein [Scandinavium lactucae]|uniref:Polymerase nucleotidyl transferase domain-containing protein n=1 Tax=Scandinavium lactucae TaxID=3095028 RepID=A0ABU4QWC0_9ENTR|nr:MULTISPECIES: hypothetical protein [unclassified Scandinavium]MDX6042624.1 hypothetical protein [Scandinavium sp. V105_6]MDX6052625.1 hypothetical protein [Scandinavium sp. V105_1]